MKHTFSYKFKQKILEQKKLKPTKEITFKEMRAGKDGYYVCSDVENSSSDSSSDFYNIRKIDKKGDRK